jgi:ribose/xylose/arabinose/galactoside ABC-type transport system permease subunit
LRIKDLAREDSQNPGRIREVGLGLLVGLTFGSLLTGLQGLLIGWVRANPIIVSIAALAVREVIDLFRSKPMIEGFQIGKSNRRGVTNPHAPRRR